MKKGERKIKIPGAGVQAVEGNPLTEEEILMFEMFEREGWTHEHRRAYILANLPTAQSRPK